jgi:hypothetical protein
MRYVLLCLVVLLLVACHDVEAPVVGFPNGCVYTDTLVFTDGSGSLPFSVETVSPACDSLAIQHPHHVRPK